jgi:hypothetical protein
MQQPFTSLSALAQHARAGRVVFTDAEYTHGALLSDYGRPRDSDWKEVVQIGAVRVVNGTITERFLRDVRPRARDLSDAEWAKFTAITGLDRITVEARGRAFEDVWSEFVAFVGADPLVVMLGDAAVFKWNWRLLGHDRDAEIDAMQATRLKPLLPEHVRDRDSGELYKLVSAEATRGALVGTAHTGLFDATSMALYVCAYERE